MKRKLRILRIWFFGKYNYLKKVHRWRMGQLFRDLQQISPKYYGYLSNMLNLNLLEEKLNKALEQETAESLTTWFNALDSREMVNKYQNESFTLLIEKMSKK